MSNKRDTLEAKIEELGTELDELFAEACEVADDARNFRGELARDEVEWPKINNVAQQYEIWFNDSLTLIEEYLPKREADFVDAYAEIESMLRFENMEGIPVDSYKSVFAQHIIIRDNLLVSIPRKVETEQLRVRKVVSNDIVMDEIYEAKALWDDGNVRAAGVVAGVALERHLVTLCEVSERDLSFSRSDNLMQLATTLETAGEIKDSTKSHIEFLSKIRNKCAHADQEEPERREVERLIDQTQDVIRGTKS